MIHPVIRVRSGQRPAWLVGRVRLEYRRQVARNVIRKLLPLTGWIGHRCLVARIDVVRRARAIRLLNGHGTSQSVVSIRRPVGRTSARLIRLRHFLHFSQRRAGARRVDRIHNRLKMRRIRTSLHSNCPAHSVQRSPREAIRPGLGLRVSGRVGIIGDCSVRGRRDAGSAGTVIRHRQLFAVLAGLGGNAQPRVVRHRLVVALHAGGLRRGVVRRGIRAGGSGRPIRPCCGTNRAVGVIRVCSGLCRGGAARQDGSACPRYRRACIEFRGEEGARPLRRCAPSRMRTAE